MRVSEEFRVLEGSSSGYAKTRENKGWNSK